MVFMFCDLLSVKNDMRFGKKSGSTDENIITRKLLYCRDICKKKKKLLSEKIKCY